MMSAKGGGIPQELLALAEQSAAAQLTEAALDDRFGRRSTWLPTAGQLWRAVHEDVTALVLLVAVDAESVSAVPVTVESTDVDIDTIVFDGSSLGAPVTVWTGLRRSLPVEVLDRPIDDLGAVAVQQVMVEAAAGREPVTGLAASDTRAELVDDLVVLATATAEVDTALDTAEAAPAAGVDLDALEPDVLEEALVEAAARLGVSLPVVLELIDGRRPPTPAEADVLRATVGGVPETSPPPSGLVVELAQPKWRGLVRQFRRQGHTTDHGVRTTMAYEINAMAARQTGDREPYWPDRILRWAEAHQLDVDADA
ncbi:hypothetical protein ACQPZA_18810 [Pseudonocardia xinjiangensis]|uniref:hypothetical protein n=1 Tax=Pseudonocardia xinjiangensis TaxID=75289 RepID=UPI003D8F8889